MNAAGFHFDDVVDGAEFQSQVDGDVLADVDIDVLLGFFFKIRDFRSDGVGTWRDGAQKISSGVVGRRGEREAFALVHEGDPDSRNSGTGGVGNNTGHGAGVELGECRKWGKEKRDKE